MVGSGRFMATFHLFANVFKDIDKELNAKKREERKETQRAQSTWLCGSLRILRSLRLFIQ
jgi:hypothetical protein